MVLATNDPIDKGLREKLKETFQGMMRALYKEEGASLRIGILAEPAAQEFIGTHTNALDSSFQQVEMSDIMRQRLSRSNYVFSGMKAFHELNEAFPSLLDENGNRKTFERFLKDVQSIDKTYNRNYLRSEYNFVQASAEMAAKWEGHYRCVLGRVLPAEFVELQVFGRPSAQIALPCHTSRRGYGTR